MPVGKFLNVEKGYQEPQKSRGPLYIAMDCEIICIFNNLELLDIQEFQEFQALSVPFVKSQVALLGRFPLTDFYDLRPSPEDDLVLTYFNLCAVEYVYSVSVRYGDRKD